MKKLIKLAIEKIEYLDFEKTVIRSLRWYNVPLLWTKKELKEFYQKTRNELK